jgi:hypothetical protein
VKKLLLQLDPDRHASAFDRIVGYDAGADEVLSYGGVQQDDVRSLVHGAIFTRGPADLHHTAIFIGGTEIARAERLLEEVQRTFFGPFRVSVVFDPNGSNTTAAAAVLKVVRAIGGEVQGRRAVVLAGTGPVGTRAAGLLARLGAKVAITSRQVDRAQAAAAQIRERFRESVDALAVAGPGETEAALDGAEIVLSCGPAGVQLLPRQVWAGRPGLRVIADVNAVPPAGIEGVDPTDDGVERDGVVAFGALGIGRLKMKLHKACVARAFERNDLILDSEAIYDLATGF